VEVDRRIHANTSRDGLVILDDIAGSHRGVTFNRMRPNDESMNINKC
jgi:hypothetical protein